MPHNLFQQNEWDETVVHLYSFSKAYRLTGHRVGALVTSEKRLGEVEKFLDTVSICPNQLGQKAALWGMQNLSEWLKGERLEILRRRQLKVAICVLVPALASSPKTALAITLTVRKISKNATDIATNSITFTETNSSNLAYESAASTPSVTSSKSSKSPITLGM